jgi:hypothetical protein
MNIRNRVVSIFVLVLFLITPYCIAQESSAYQDQVPFKTIHIFNLRPKFSADDAKSVLEKFNRLFVKLGHPECHYKLWESSGEEKQPRYLWESFWTNRAVYDEIHKNSEYRKLVREEFLGLRRMFQDHTYYRYYELPFSAALTDLPPKN